ncbi:MAG: hypothetical protein AAGA48_28985 [Myxococcota bacterium]
MPLNRRDVLQGLSAGLSLGVPGTSAAASCSPGLCPTPVGLGRAGGYKILEIFLSGAFSHRETLYIENPTVSIPWRTVDTFDPRLTTTLMPPTAPAAWRSYLPSAQDYYERDYQLNGEGGTVHLGPGGAPLVKEYGPIGARRTLLERARLVTVSHRYPVHREAQRVMLHGDLAEGERRGAGPGAVISRFRSTSQLAPSFVFYSEISGDARQTRDFAIDPGLHGSIYAPIAIPFSDPSIVNRLGAVTNGDRERLIRLHHADYARRLTFTSAPLAGERARARAFDRLISTFDSAREGSAYASALSALVPSGQTVETFWTNPTRRAIQASADLLATTATAYCGVIDPGVEGSVYDTHDEDAATTALMHTGNLINVLRTVHELVSLGTIDLDQTLVAITTEFGRHDYGGDRSNHFNSAFNVLFVGGPIAKPVTGAPRHLVGHIDVSDPPVAKPPSTFSTPLGPSDVRAAMLAAAGVHPIQTTVFETTDLKRSADPDQIAEDLFGTFFA